VTFVSRSEPPQAPVATSDAELLRRAAGGDRVAFGTIYDRHVHTVYRYALSLLRSVPDAEDVTQDVFVAAWGSAGKVRLVDESALPWLLVTTRRTGANRSRELAKRTSLPDTVADRLADERLSPEDAAEQAQLRSAITDAVASLSEVDQHLYMLCIDHGMSYADAAKQLGVTHGVVRNRLSRLRTTLQTALAPTRGEP
jgi:RNA polymerase sigma-70 factor (ECF subfamily)